MNAIMVHLTLRSVAVGYLSCLAGVILCVLGNVLVAAVNDITYQAIDLLIGPKSNQKGASFSSADFFVNVVTAAVMGKIGWVLAPIFKKKFGFWGTVLLAGLKFVIKQIVQFLIRGAISVVSFVWQYASKATLAAPPRRERK